MYGSVEIFFLIPYLIYRSNTRKLISSSSNSSINRGSAENFEQLPVPDFFRRCFPNYIVGNEFDLVKKKIKNPIPVRR